MADQTPGNENPQTNTPFPAARLVGLDALRGLAVLLMCLSGLLPKYLPNAMYHGYHPSYLPEPAMTVDGEAAADEAGAVPLVWEPVENPFAFVGVEWPSFTWVDWVFPAFLFAMGAAIPLAYARRRAKGESAWRLAASAFGRFLVLVGFAVYVKQMSPWHQASREGASVGLAEYWTAVLGLLLLLPVLARLPKGTPRRLAWSIRGLGFVGAVVFLAVVNDRPTNPPFSWNPATGDADIIILLLAWCSLVAAWLWLITRGAGWFSWSVRLLLGLGVAFIAHQQAMRPDWRVFGDAIDPWNTWLQAPKAWLDLVWLNDSLPGNVPTGWLDLSVLYDFAWLKFLWVVVPGTVVGDVLVRYLGEQRRVRQPVVATPTKEATEPPAFVPVAKDEKSDAEAEVQRDPEIEAPLNSPIPPLAVGDAGAQPQTTATDDPAGWVPPDTSERWGLGRLALLSASLLACVVAVFVGLKDYAGPLWGGLGVNLATPYAAVFLGMPPLGLALALTLKGGGGVGVHERTLRSLTYWGAAWLVLGLLLAIWPDPRVVSAEGTELWATFGAGYFEAGIGKGPPARLSWYLTSLGVSVLALVALMAWTDARGWRWPVGWLTATGQNPMLAYAMLGGPLAAAVALPWLMPVVSAGTAASPDGYVAAWIAEWYGPEASPWHDAGWDAVKTLGLAGVVWVATKRGLVLRS